SLDRIGGGHIFSHKLSVCAQAVNAIDPSKRNPWKGLFFPGVSQRIERISVLKSQKINFNINTKRFTIIRCSTFAPLLLGANLVKRFNPIV
ncbi:MAG: hypothetical protein MUO88_01310, partial [Desulfobacterales bacterium]|nr:hypothetical protein [Desulfobacterales bacterium]